MYGNDVCISGICVCQNLCVVTYLSSLANIKNIAITEPTRVMKIFTSDTTLNKPSHQLNLIWQPHQYEKSYRLGENYMLMQILENLPDGILMISFTGEIIHANSQGLQLCASLNDDNKKAIPSIIWQICESIIEPSQNLPANQIVSNEITLDALQSEFQQKLRISVRLIEIENNPIPYFLVTIANHSESAKNLAIAETKQYHLTPREAEIWYLYRTNHTYKNIASRLYITINTVKKHMKNIYAKRQAFLDGQY